MQLPNNVEANIKRIYVKMKSIVYEKKKLEKRQKEKERLVQQNQRE